MVTKTINKLPKSVVEVSATVPWADVSPKWEAAYERLSKEVELPGFRKGEAPKDMVEPKIMAQLQQETLRDVMPQSLIEALQGSDIIPIDYPQYQVVSFNKGQDLQFNARVTERPEVKIGDYKGIKPTKTTAKTISDADVDKVVEDLFKRWQARTNPGSATPPTDNSGTSGSMSFNQQTTKSETPDDNFAKAVGADSLADLKSKIKSDMETEAKSESELDYEEAILQEVEKMTTVDVPEVLVSDELNRMLVSLQRKVADMGLLMEDYLKSQNETLDSIKDKWKAQAEKNVRMELGLSEIAKSENVTISDDELKAEIDKIQDQRIKSQFEAEEPKMHLRHALRQTKTLNLLKNLAG